jgi:uncharacterized membrane protein (DUF4010 family)
MPASALGIVVAALGGLAVGIERQWSGHATGPRAHFAGIRTFTLLGGAGGLAGWLWAAGLPAVAIVLIAAAATLIVAAYVAASRVDVDATTEVSALVVLTAGILAGLGYYVLASATVAVVTLILVEKSRLHAMVARIDDEPLRAAARFGVMAVVILPLLPEGPYGPGVGVRPRELWLLVLFFSGLNFAGYIGRRSVGARYGYPLAGLLGGLVSSTNVTYSFARQSGPTAHGRLGLAYGVVAACATLFVRVAVATAALNARLLSTLWPYLVPPFVVGVAAVGLGLRHMHREPEVADHPRNPLRVLEAAQMAVIFQVVLFLVDAARRLGGDAGVVVSGAVVGLTDLDALTLSMARAAGQAITPELAGQAIAAGLISNTIVKIAIAVLLGAPKFRGVVAASLGAMIAVLVATLVVMR